GSKVLTNSRDNTLKIVDLRTYDVEQTLHADGYKTGANWSKSCFSPDGRYVAAGSLGKNNFLLFGSSSVCGVSWSPQGGQVFSADKDRTVCIWAGGLR
ncbi:6342_t:CDS:2, partial [Cetraspora pellucida]